MYQDLYNKVKKIIPKTAYTTFYDVSRPLYLESDASGVNLGAGLPQVMRRLNWGHD